MSQSHYAPSSCDTDAVSSRLMPAAPIAAHLKKKTNDSVSENLLTRPLVLCVVCLCGIQ